MIAVVQGACVGGGVDMISACDIRYCTSDAFFQIKVSKWAARDDSHDVIKCDTVISSSFALQ